MTDWKLKYLKYKNKYLNLNNSNDAHQIINSYNQTGGTTNNNYEELKQKLYNVIRNPAKDPVNNKTLYDYFVEYYNKYYQLKIDKYNELKSVRETNNENILRLTTINKENLVNSLNQMGSQYDTDYVFSFPAKDLDDNILEVYESNYNLLVYSDIIGQINNKKRNLKTQLRQNINEFLIECDKLNTADMDIIRIEIIEYLLKISKGSININTYIPFNYILTGYPGIGKSYNANLVAKLLGKSGLLCNDTVTYIKKPDIIAQYIGQTAPKVYKKLSQSLESIIFLDEAYSFAGPKDTQRGFDKYGQEALDAITDFTSEHQGLISVIAAGYPIEMKTQFLDVNPGLPRRFPLVIKLNRYKVYDILNISLKKTKLLIENINTMDNTSKESIIICTLLFIIKLVLNFDFKINSNIINDIQDAITKISSENNINYAIFRQYAELTIQSTRNIYIHTGTQYFRILTINQANRYPFNNLQGNGTGIEWFLLCNLLNKTTDLNDGDLFSFQASDINEYTEIYVNTIILNHFIPHTPINILDIVDDLYFNVTINIFKQKNISIEFNDVPGKPSENQITLLDHNNYINSLINDLNITTEEEFLKILFKKLYYEYEETIKLEEEKTSRSFTLFSLSDLRNMKQNTNIFIKQEPTKEEQYIKDLQEQYQEQVDESMQRQIEHMDEKEQMKQQIQQQQIQQIQEQHMQQMQEQQIQQQIQQQMQQMQQQLELQQQQIQQQMQQMQQQEQEKNELLQQLSIQEQEVQNQPDDEL